MDGLWLVSVHLRSDYRFSGLIYVFNNANLIIINFSCQSIVIAFFFFPGDAMQNCNEVAFCHCCFFILTVALEI